MEVQSLAKSNGDGRLEGCDVQMAMRETIAYHTISTLSTCIPAATHSTPACPETTQGTVGTLLAGQTWCRSVQLGLNDKARSMIGKVDLWMKR